MMRRGEHRLFTARCHNLRGMTTFSSMAFVGSTSALRLNSRPSSWCASRSQPVHKRAVVSPRVSFVSRSIPRATLEEKERQKERLGFKEIDNGVVNAIERLGTGRVTVADVASQAGSDVRATERQLMLVAEAVGAKLEVSNSGEILFGFPNGIRRKIQSSSFQLKLKAWFEKAWPVIFYLLRIGFGAFLFVSIFFIFAALSALSATNNSQDNRDNRGYNNYSYYGGGGYGNRLFGPNLFDVFYWNNFNRWYYGERYQEYTGEEKSRPMNFLESIFSFVFGDGDPNRGLDDKKWKAIAATIRSNGGAVTREQLLPFLEPPSEKAAQLTDSSEQEVFPVLVRFRGSPEVTEDGDIIYVFPEMTSTASSEVVRDPRGRFIEEEKWKLSKANGGQQLFAAGLGAVNLFGMLALKSAVGSAEVVTRSSPALLASVKAFLPFLQAYAWTFALVPVARYFWLRQRNSIIDKANAFRKKAAMVLLNPTRELLRKEKAAKSYKTDKGFVSDQDVSYSTDRDSTALDESGLGDFDRRLK